ncbi:MAG TPA: hypothetical protein VF695_04915 [Sphingomonas sp.]|jgi:hypothetical protein
MRLPRLNNRATVASLLAGFERRFVRIDRGVIYVAREGGDGVRLTQEEAASLIAGVRATLIEADGDTGALPNWGWDGAVAVGLVTIIIGTLAGFPLSAIALFLPVLAAFFALGPVLGVVRVHLAHGRAQARVERQLAAHRRVPAAAVRRGLPVNPVQPVLAIVAAGVAAVFAGLMIAAAIGPFHVKVWIDQLIAGWALPVVVAVVVLAFVSHAIDATRRRVSEAAIADAMADRRRRPID